MEDNSNSKDDIYITNNDKNIFNIDTFSKWIKAAKDFNNFKNYKISFLRGFSIFS